MAIATPTPFVSKAQLQCQQNLATYIHQARVVSPVWKQVPGSRGKLLSGLLQGAQSVS